MRLLHVDSSVLGSSSASRALSADVVAAERARVPGLTVTYRDLAAEPLDHLSSAYVAAVRGGVVDPSPAAQRELAEGRAALDEFLAADIVVIGAPMYNFGLPSQLKAWLDRIIEKGKTFEYGEQGPRGLAGGKRVIIVSSRGGMYGSDSPMASLDHQETHLRGVFGFLGVTDVRIVRAEGLNMTGRREPAIAAARESIAQLV